MRHIYFKIIAFGFALLAVSPSHAQSSATVPIDVTLSVIDGCVINGNGTRSALSFGKIQNPVAHGFDIVGSTTAPILVSCNVGSTTAAFSVGGGVNSSGELRRMRNPSAISGSSAEFLAYRIYTDVARSTEYTINTPLSVNGGVITAGIPFEIQLSGLILASDLNQAVAGDYSDLIQAILTF